MEEKVIDLLKIIKYNVSKATEGVNYIYSGGSSGGSSVDVSEL